MPVEINIQDTVIKFAESILLPEDHCFDEERIEFIKSLKTLDLEAVPGSGKTTVLLAKLIALDRILPTRTNKGILVISHTNAAVDEIKKKIGNVCPRLFTHPNYIGTIQGFVDRFIGIPGFVQQTGSRPVKIDADAYNDAVERLYSSLAYRTQKWLERRDKPVEFLINLRFDNELNLTSGVGGKIELKSKNASSSYKSIAKLKLNLYRQGYLHYDDVFFFAEQLLKSNSSFVKNILRRRFPIVFVDEMQDMAKHQCSILESLFGPESSDTIFQRIGDSDQAIHGEDGAIESDLWSCREENMTLSNSLRLSPQIAKLLPPLAYGKYKSFEINGLNTSNIKPHMLLFDNESIQEVLPYYADLIHTHQENNKISPNSGPFMAIAWNSEWPDASQSEGKLRLIDFYPKFKKSVLSQKIEFTALADYCAHVNPLDRTLKSASEMIKLGVCKALSEAEILNPESQRPFTPNMLVAYFRHNGSEDLYDRFKSILFRHSSNLVIGNVSSCLSYLKVFLRHFITFLRGDYEKAKLFIEATPTQQPEVVEDKFSNPNLYTSPSGIDVGLATVHSVKGQTHVATLYIESAYYNDAGKMYESQRLANQLKGKKLTSSAPKRIKSSAKMLYVGFSRPTHLLAFAVHKDNYASYLASENLDNWEVIALTGLNAHKI